MVTESTIKYLKNNAICFKVFGNPDNEHRPYFEQDSGEGSTFQNSDSSKEIDTTAGEAPSQEFSLKENMANTSAEEAQNNLRDYQEPEQVEMAEPKTPEQEDAKAETTGQTNERFDEMFIYGAQPNVNEDEEGGFGERTYSQSVYQQPNALISDNEKAEYLASQPRDDHFIESQNSSGKKSKKNKSGKKKKGKKDKDCTVF